MKTITKKSLEELAKEMPVIEEFEMRQVIGGDKYVFNEMGALVNVIPDLNNYFTVLDENGKEKAEMALSDQFTRDTEDWPTGSMFVGRAITEDVFKFMADNTKVEWALSTNSGGGLLTTSEQMDRVAHPLDPDNNEYEKFYHSHPDSLDYNDISDEDKDDARSREAAGYEEFYIYHPDNGSMISYDKNGRN